MKCGRNTKSCRKCERRYKKEEGELSACPACGESRPCTSVAMTNGACRMHGGVASVGAASPRFKHGRYSKHMPARLLDKFKEAQRDPDRLSLTDDIDALTARIGDLMSRVEDGESASLWKQAQATFEEFASAQVAKDRDAAISALQKLGSLLRRGVGDVGTWNEIKQLWKQRVRMVESERKRAIENQEMIAVEKALGLIAAVADTVKRNVTDPTALANITHDLARLTRGEAARLSAAGAGARGQAD